MMPFPFVFVVGSPRFVQQMRDAHPFLEVVVYPGEACGVYITDPKAQVVVEQGYVEMLPDAWRSILDHWACAKVMVRATEECYDDLYDYLTDEGVIL